MENKNTYYKFAPNVFVAKCSEEHNKLETIILTTKYGKENECTVINLVGQKDGFFYYSIVRTDGFDSQQWALNKVEKINGYASNAQTRSNQHYKDSHEGRDFLSLGEPIKVGHHSEKRHRALIERNWNRMDKSVAESKKVEEYAERVKYYEHKANQIDASMPESLEYFEHKYNEALDYHLKMKSGEIERTHSYSLTYAKKEVNNWKKKFELAKKLWK